MRGDGCNDEPTWRVSPTEPSWMASLERARGIDELHIKLHPGSECTYQAAALAYIANAEQRMDDEQPQGLLHRADGSIAAVYPDGLVLNVAPPDDR